MYTLLEKSILNLLFNPFLKNYGLVDMCFNQRSDISVLKGRPLKLVDKFIYLVSSVLSTETDINTRLAKAWTAVVVSILLYACTTWTLTKRMEKKLDGNYTRMLWAIPNESWKQHPTKQQLYGHLPLIKKTIQVRRTKRAEHCWRNKDELISDILLWTPSHERAKAERPTRTYIQQLYVDIEYSLEDFQTVERGGERGSGRSVLAAWYDDNDSKIELNFINRLINVS